MKAHLEALGYTVRAEVGKCDVVGTSGDTMIAVELKLNFGLSVLYQALRRLPSVDLVYVAVAVPDGRRARANWDAQIPDAIRLCRMLGVGLLSIRNDKVIAHADPAPYQPRKRPKLRARLLSEFVRRSGDHNLGGTNRRPRITAYREDALACARVLAEGAMKAASVRTRPMCPRPAPSCAPTCTAGSRKSPAAPMTSPLPAGQPLGYTPTWSRHAWSE